MTAQPSGGRNNKTQQREQGRMKQATAERTEMVPGVGESDPETELIMEILKQINAELDEIAEKIEAIGQID